ncbi:hypothetical protein [Pseudomonas sp. O11]|uniref:hypothetical protein n=1 Tax=Pseudomonas sp. O11 TaxID=3159446 RepID=UPI00387AE197
MSVKYRFDPENIEFTFELAEKALILLATENPAAVKLAEAYLSMCHDSLMVGIVVEE